MAARLIDGKALAQQVRDRLAKESAELLALKGVKPGLATILVGDDPASHIYVKNKQKACELAGIYVDDHKLPAATTQAELLALIEKKNADPRIHGILVQLPLPNHIDSKVILEAVSPLKDADGFHPVNLKLFFKGKGAIQPVFPEAIMKLIKSVPKKYYLNKKAIILANSRKFGEVMEKMLAGEKIKGKYILAPSFFSALSLKKKEVLKADIIISALGRSGIIKGGLIKRGTVIIDGGIIKKGRRILGNVDSSSVEKAASYLTPVPGGVGPVTVATLMENVYKLAKNK